MRILANTVGLAATLLLLSHESHAADTAPVAPPQRPSAPAAAPTTFEQAKSLPEPALEITARIFYSRLLNKDAEGLAALCRPPFFFEAKAVATADEVKRRWSQMLENKSLDGVPLYGIDFLTPEEMIGKHGKPPEKLAGWTVKGGMLTVGNLGGRAAVVLWRKTGKDWQATGYHD
jgi:hypothetical protein